MSEDRYLTVSTGPVRMKVDGLSRVLRAAEKAGADAQDMKDLMHEIGMIVVREARKNAPRGETGKLVGSLKAGHGKTKAVVRAGGTRVPYGGVIHWGTPGLMLRDLFKRRTIGHYRQTLFLTRALQATQREAIQKLSDGLGKILKDNNFDIARDAGL